MFKLFYLKTKMLSYINRIGKIKFKDAKYFGNNFSYASKQF